MPYINVDEAYILDNTGLQVDNSVDYANANSNRNLLDNPFFTINQRSFTSGSTVAYTVDRWKNNTSGSTVSLSSGVISIPANCVFLQLMDTDLYASLVGKTVTLSVMYSDGNIESGSITVPSSGATYASGTPRLAMNGTSKSFYCYPNSAISVKAFKLELGSYSTLINDVPPDYGEELAKCQYYYREIKCTTTGYAMIGFATAATAFQACLPYTMRVRPSITYSGSLTAYYAGGNSAVTAVAANAEFTNSIQVAFTTTGLTAGSIVALAMGSGAKLMFSADL